MDLTRPTKRQKPTPLPPANFWDYLSEIPLTRRALREHDRRNNLQTLEPCWEVCLECNTDLDLDLYPNKLRHFAESGPDLRDIRGVSSNECVAISSNPLLSCTPLLLKARD